MSTIKYVQISPFYCGCGWYDYLSGINFAKTRKNEPIRIPEGTNLTNIRKYLAKNLLIDVTAKYDKTVVEEADNKDILARSLAGMSSNVILKEEAYDVKEDAKEKAEEAVVETTTESVIDEVTTEEKEVEVEDKEQEGVKDIPVVEDAKPVTKNTSKKNKSKK